MLSRHCHLFLSLLVDHKRTSETVVNIFTGNATQKCRTIFWIKAASPSGNDAAGPHGLLAQCLMTNGATNLVQRPGFDEVTIGIARIGADFDIS